MTAPLRSGLGRLFFRVDDVIRPLLDALALFLEAGGEIARAILEEHEKTKREKQEKNQPEKAAQ